MACVGERYNRYGKRLLLQADGEIVYSVPPQWTDLIAPDPELVLGARRSWFLVQDLVALAGLIDQLGRGGDG